MINSVLQSYYGDDCPFEFGQDTRKLFKVYSDGSHFIARESKRGKRVKRDIKLPSEMDEFFELLYTEGVQADMLDKELRTYILTGLEDYFPDYPKLEKYVDKNIERKLRNQWKREKRFRRKAYLNRWNYFVTFTYSDLKHTEDTFKKKLRKCLSNLHTRRGWRFMGVYERGEENDRLHFHCLLYVPAGEMLGEITERLQYSRKTGRIKTTYPNSFFERKFGFSDFKELNIMEMRNGSAVNYLLKYLRKTGERVVYSRGTPMEITKRLGEENFAAEIENDYVQKFVIFDNVIDYERDIKPYTERKLRYVKYKVTPKPYTPPEQISFAV